MKRKIYNKKKFWSGIVFLLLAVIGIPLDIIHFDDLSTMKNIKHVLVDAFCLLIGVTSVYRSLSSSCTKEDEQNDDEREKLVTLKSKSSAFTIMFYIYITIIILTMLAFSKTQHEGLIGVLAGCGFLFIIMMITEMSCYFYHNKRT